MSWTSILPSPHGPERPWSACWRCAYRPATPRARDRSEHMIDAAGHPVDIRRARAVVVGSGIAGLPAALGLEDAVVLTRGALGSGSSRHAQGGIAAALAAGDSAADHALDTLAVS